MIKIISIFKNLRSHYTNRNNLIFSIVGILILNLSIIYLIKNTKYIEYTPQYHIFLGSYEDQPLYKLNLFLELININTSQLNSKNDSIFDKDEINSILSTKITSDKSGHGIDIYPPSNLEDKNYNAIHNYFMNYYNFLEKIYDDRHEMLSYKIQNNELTIASLNKLREKFQSDSTGLSTDGLSIAMQATVSIDTQILRFKNDILELYKSNKPPALIKPSFHQNTTINKKFQFPLTHPYLFILCIDILVIILLPMLLLSIKENRYLLK